MHFSRVYTQIFLCSFGFAFFFLTELFSFIPFQFSARLCFVMNFRWHNLWAGMRQNFLSLCRELWVLHFYRDCKDYALFNSLYTLTHNIFMQYSKTLFFSEAGTTLNLLTYFCLRFDSFPWWVSAFCGHLKEIIF